MYSTNLIKEDLVEIIDNTLDPASDILRIAITDENGSLNASEPWNGDQTSIGKWNVFSNQTKVSKLIHYFYIVLSRFRKIKF